MEFFTIGVYNSTSEEFFRRLIRNGIDTFCDIRQRRGVRGSKYAFVNSEKLQKRLADLNIRYVYIKDLAPSTRIRNLQKEADEKKGEAKSVRRELGPLFVEKYKSEILEPFDFVFFFNTLQSVNANRVALFCVEQYPRACHRSLIADELNARYLLEVTHL
jgi:uncharacterized protein (DUF488 family)